MTGGIPSYDDLTPGIPDEVDAKSVDQLALFLRHVPKSVNKRTGGQEDVVKTNSPHLLSSCAKTPLFACLRLEAASGPREADSGELEAAGGQREAGSPKLEAGRRKPEALLAIARDFSPRVMVASEREVLLDVSGLGGLIGEPQAIAAALVRSIEETGMDARVAIAPTQTTARLLAAGGGADLMPLPVTLLAELETLPAAINHRDRARPYETLERWGIHTLGDLAALPAADLSSRLGRRGVALQRLARGLDPRPLVPDAGTPRYIGRLELEWPVDALEPLSFVFARLLEPLSAALERADRGAIAIHLELRLTTRATDARVLQLPAPMRDPKVLRTLLLLDLESHPPSPLCGVPPSPAKTGFGGTGGETSSVTAAVDIVSIELDPAPARITQFSLLERALPSAETLSTLTARLSALVGETRVGSAVLLDTHRPDAFEMARFAPDWRAISSRRSDEVAKTDEMAHFAPEQGAGSKRPGLHQPTDVGRTSQFAPEQGAGPKRPGLHQPTDVGRISQVAPEQGAGSKRLGLHQPTDVGRTSQVRLDEPGAREPACNGVRLDEPDLRGPAYHGDKQDAVLRRQRVPPAIRVRVEHGRPVYIAATKRSMPQGAVTQAAGPWRTSGGWWTLPPDPPPPGLGRSAGALRARTEGDEIRPWSRDEWDVALKSGAVCRIYQDRTTERWFLEGIYD